MLHSLPAVLLSAATRLRQPQQRVVTSLQHGRGARQGNWPQRLSPRRGTTPQQLAASSGGQDSNHEEARGHQCGEDALTNSKAQQQPPKDPWEQARLQVIAFREQHGRLPRANADALGPLVPGERPLGLWCTTQQRRKAGSKGRPLTVQERASLASIPGWNWWPSKRERVSWEHRLQQLQEFVQQSGRLPRSTASSDHPFLPNEKQLGPWALTQRNRYKGHKQPQLSTEQVAALESVPGWYWAAYEVQPWEQRLQQLHDFVHQHGRLPRHTARRGHPFLPGEKELGLWADRQRQCYKGQRLPQLSAERVAALETVPGWYWAAFEMQPWEQRYQQVADFMRQHDRLPKCHPSSQAPMLPGEKELWAWCSRQRQRLKGQRHIGAPLTPEQQVALEALPRWYWEGSLGRGQE